MMRARGLAAVVALVGLAVAGAARAEWVRDEIRLNVRVQPGNQFRIERVIESGDSVDVIEENEEWVRIRTADGHEGWVPSGYLTEAAPPSVLLPRSERKLERAQAEIQQLEGKLAEHAAAIHELDSLRLSNRKLDAENRKLESASRWRILGMGGAIVLVGMLVGIGVGTRLAGGAKGAKLRI